MPAVTRHGMDASSGHCYPPHVTDSAGQGSVFVNGALAVVKGGHYPTHCCGLACHDSMATGCSATVIVEGKGIHRIGDAHNCGDASAAGSSNVFAGG